MFSFLQPQASKKSLRLWAHRRGQILGSLRQGLSRAWYLKHHTIGFLDDRQNSTNLTQSFQFQHLLRHFDTPPLLQKNLPKQRRGVAVARQTLQLTLRIPRLGWDGCLYHPSQLALRRWKLLALAAMFPRPKSLPRGRSVCRGDQHLMGKKKPHNVWFGAQHVYLNYHQFTVSQQTSNNHGDSWLITIS